MTLRDKFGNFQIILASQSPRRKELLEGMDIDFRIQCVSVEESYPQTLKKQEITDFLTEKKKQAYQK